MVREVSFGEFKLVEYEQFRLNEPAHALLALPDTGLVGVIGAGHIVKVLKLREVGGIDSYVYLPPIAVVSRREVRLPVRIFASDNLLVVYSEFMPPPAAFPSLSRILLDYFERKGVTHILMASGIAIQNRFESTELKTYYLTTSADVERILRETGIQPFENGFLVGPYALMLKEAIRANMPATLIMTESFLEFPDPEASAKNLEVISKIIGKPIDVKELIERAETIRLRARDAMRAAMPNLARMRKDYEYSTPLNI